ncbi:MAG: bifunctional phosphopantothenoylcysteine decarboxylase/phosphopantothenate--cysteine ligase CoaBC [Candidatus Eisenbacteria bacterium]|nr:bifunctional phosphopantothenoylcysteine decarboxylase/phosphopantothenate--cysteine ligase CoaBC [Candidatus Eisenbacteria bacterium]
MSAEPRIVLGVSGGIAAYKSAELVRLLVKDGMDVRVVMSRAATRFVTPLTLGTLSGHPVLVHLFESDAAPGMRPDGAPDSWAPDEIAPGIEHIDIIKDADLVVVAPATADLLAKVAHGLADDALTTVLLAAGPRVFLAPAMNHRMWNHPATQANLALLRSRGAVIIEPGAGYQACGETGVGRMAEPTEIHESLRAGLIRRNDLAGRTVVLTAGRTEEPIDPVRVLTNRSSGRMGVALAEEARDRGARVVMVSGVLSVEPPAGVSIVSATTALAMRGAVLDAMKDADILVAAAAVADFRPMNPATDKIKRTGGLDAIELEPTIDILKEAAGRRQKGQIMVGFALETSSELESARKKLADKGVDLIVLNNPTRSGSEFGGDTNEVTLIAAGGATEKLPLQSKRQVARAIFDRVVGLLDGATTSR